jgi:signal transduction histidine kinase
MLGRVRQASLRSRLAVTLAGLSALAVTSLGGVYLFTEHVIEQTALRREMSEELLVLMEHENRGEHVTPLSTSLRYFAAGTAPAGLAELPAGAFRRLRFEGKVLQALTAADGAGGVHVLTHDMSLAEHREHSLLLSLIAGVATASVAAWWVAGRLARRTLSPLTGLVEQIRGIDPLQPTQRPVARTGDVDVDVIPDAVNALVQELDHVLQRERAFADAASHELRTPLAVVRGAIDLLRERGDAPSPIIDRMERAARRAQEDLEALLALSPARAPAAAKLVDLRDLLPAAAEPYLREGTARVVWDWTSPSEARVEPAALAIVFTNLLRNALRAAPQGEVRIEADAGGVRIVDDGEGLPPGWPAAGEPRGRGLGLLIAQTLAERHGWRLSVEPAEPRGTRASLVLVSESSV